MKQKCNCNDFSPIAIIIKRMVRLLLLYDFNYGGDCTDRDAVISQLSVLHVVGQSRETCTSFLAPMCRLAVHWRYHEDACGRVLLHRIKPTQRYQ